MFSEENVIRLNIPEWEEVYRAEIMPGVLSFIAVHDISRGISLGGCRMAKYDNEACAITDVLRLSRGMTYKNAVADLPLGGGKAIIVCDPNVKGNERQKILEEFGKFVAWVNKDQEQYITAEDMNTSVEDMHIVKNFTKHLCGTDIDPSPFTAYGVFSGIEYSTEFFALDLFEGDGNLKNKSILIQGVGKVGQVLVDYLSETGAQIYICDINEENINLVQKKYPEVKVVHPSDMYNQKVDIFVPCAKGEVVTENNIDKLKFKIICGGANNQLQNHEIGEKLHKKGIVYCPDYVVNMGGVCSLQYIEFDKLDNDTTLKKIRDTVRKMLGLTFRTALKKNFTFDFAVDHAVDKIISSGKHDHNEFSNKKLFPLTASHIVED